MVRWCAILWGIKSIHRVGRCAPAAGMVSATFACAFLAAARPARDARRV
jgi:hypothetical protein